jgi:uncharacterized protein YprB with RNaseH-like and TPR domain
MTKIIFDIESTGLIENLFERIICIGIYNLDAEEKKVFQGEEETILQDFFNYVNSCNKLNEPPILIGFNSDSFDLPFIIRRAVIYKKKVPYFINLDLRKIINGFKYSYNRMEKGRLKDWAKALGIPVETSPGSETFRLYCEGKLDLIAQHCLEDVRITKKIYEHADSCGLIQTQLNSIMFKSYNGGKNG